MTYCSVLWCSNNCLGECLIDTEVDGPVYPDDFDCTLCDVFLKDGLVLKVPDCTAEEIDKVLADCAVAYVNADPKAGTIVIKELGRNPENFQWVAVRASKEDAETLHVFPHIDGGLASKYIAPGQTELDLGV